MKNDRTNPNNNGLTLIELLAVIAVIAILAAFLLPTSHGGPSRMMVCLNHQRQTDLAFNIWASDNGGTFPWQVSETNHGVLEVYGHGYAAADFRMLQAYSIQPAFLICPTDLAKKPATNLASLQNENLSYFVGFDCSSNATAGILTGDRHLVANRNPVKPGLFTYSTNSTMGWSRELHSANSSQPYGIVSFYDGHVEVVRGNDLNSAFQRQALPTARYAVP